MSLCKLKDAVKDNKTVALVGGIAAALGGWWLYTSYQKHLRRRDNGQYRVKRRALLKEELSAAQMKAQEAFQVISNLKLDSEIVTGNPVASIVSAFDTFAIDGKIDKGTLCTLLAGPAQQLLLSYMQTLLTSNPQVKIILASVMLDCVGHVELKMPILVDRLFDFIDRDQNGYIDETEFHNAATFACGLLQHQDMHAVMNVTFDVFDLNGDGKITAKEGIECVTDALSCTGDLLLQCCDIFEQSIDPNVEFIANGIMTALDADHDGNVTIEEFTLISRPVIKHLLSFVTGGGSVGAALEAVKFGEVLQVLHEEFSNVDYVTKLGLLAQGGITEASFINLVEPLALKSLQRVHTQALSREEKDGIADLRSVQAEIAELSDADAFFEAIYAHDNFWTALGSHQKHMEFGDAGKVIASHLFGLIDINNNGVVSHDEIAIISSLFTVDFDSQDEEQVVLHVAKVLFTLMDTDGNGEITGDELAFILRRVLALSFDSSRLMLNSVIDAYSTFWSSPTIVNMLQALMDKHSQAGGIQREDFHHFVGLLQVMAATLGSSH